MLTNHFFHRTGIRRLIQMRLIHDFILVFVYLNELRIINRGSVFVRQSPPILLLHSLDNRVLRIHRNNILRIFSGIPVLFCQRNNTVHIQHLMEILTSTVHNFLQIRLRIFRCTEHLCPCTRLLLEINGHILTLTVLTKGRTKTRICRIHLVDSTALVIQRHVRNTDPLAFRIRPCRVPTDNRLAHRQMNHIQRFLRRLRRIITPRVLRIGRVICLKHNHIAIIVHTPAGKLLVIRVQNPELHLVIKLDTRLSRTGILLERERRTLCPECHHNIPHPRDCLIAHIHRIAVRVFCR